MLKGVREAPEFWLELERSNETKSSEAQRQPRTQTLFSTTARPPAFASTSSLNLPSMDASASAQLSNLSLGPSASTGPPLSKSAVDKATLFKYRLENQYRTSVGECIEREERAAEVERRVAGKPSQPGTGAAWSGVMAADAAALSGTGTSTPAGGASGSSLSLVSPADSTGSSRQSSLASLAGLTGSGAGSSSSSSNSQGVWMSEERKAKIVRDHKRKVGS